MSVSNINKVVSSVQRKIAAANKFLQSWLKRPERWTLRDYPVWTREFDVEEFSGPARLKPVRWFATIENWCLSGTGDTKAEALQKLAEAFEYQKSKRSTLPRPGTKVPIEFASSERLSRIPHGLYNQFVDRVLGLEWVVVSDESSLWDFHSEESNDVYLAKIRDVFAVDVSDIPNGNIVAILERLAAATD